MEYNIDKPITDEDCRIRVNCHAIPGLWQYEMIAFSPGIVLRWFRDAFCPVEKMIEKQTGIDAYYLLEKEAESVPAGSNGMFCTFSDTMNYIAWKHAAPAFINFSIDAGKFDRKVFYRSILENAAIVTLSHKMILESITGNQIDGIFFASGASKSNLWCSIVSDVLGISIKVPKTKEATALGTAILAGMGAKIYTSLPDTVKNICAVGKTYEPNMSNHQIYLELLQKWQSVYKNQLKLADDGYTNYMWKAPGL